MHVSEWLEARMVPKDSRNTGVCGRVFLERLDRERPCALAIHTDTPLAHCCCRACEQRFYQSLSLPPPCSFKNPKKIRLQAVCMKTSSFNAYVHVRASARRECVSTKAFCQVSSRSSRVWTQCRSLLQKVTYPVTWQTGRLVRRKPQPEMPE